jgi:uncharacterized protein (TIGR02145 family)
VAGGKMKESGTLNWISPNTDGNNSSGWAGLPGGHRYDDGTFGSVGLNGYWWSATGNNPSSAFIRQLYYGDGNVIWHGFNKWWGFSVRCLGD